MKPDNTTSVTPAPSERLIRSLRAAHTFNRLDNALRRLPDKQSGCNWRFTSAYFQLEEATKAAQKAEQDRQKAIAALAVQLTDQITGWNEEQVLHALDNPLSN